MTRTREPDAPAGTALGLLAALAGAEHPDSTRFIKAVLEQLRAYLDLDRVAMARATGHGLDTCWWATNGRLCAEDPIHRAETFLGTRLLEALGCELDIPDVQKDPLFHAGVEAPGFRTFLGVPLRQRGACGGVLTLQSVDLRSFTRPERELITVSALLLARTLEAEGLRDELRNTRHVLNLTAAVVEDHSLESPVTRLPNRRYLDVWLKAHLYLALRRSEAMSVVHWGLDLDPLACRNLRDISTALRGQDLLVDLGAGEFLLLLPHTGIEGAQVLLDRIRTVLGPVPMGGTLWRPDHAVDRGDLELEQAMLRAREARCYSEAHPAHGRHEVQWMLLETEGES